LKHLKNIGSCIFGGEREEKRGSMESGGWWSTFVFGVAIEGNISIFSD
jgi:hypothetical protein